MNFISQIFHFSFKNKENPDAPHLFHAISNNIHWYSAPSSSEYSKLDSSWSCSFTNQKLASALCRKAILLNITPQVCRTSLSKKNISLGSIRFFVNSSDKDSSKKVIDFMIKNNLLLKNNNAYVDMSLCKDFKNIVYQNPIQLAKLSDFIDLRTGNFL